MEKKILDIIKKGEGLHTEFKLANSGLPKNLFESVCAFLNRDGGFIILGVDDNGKVVGIPRDNKNRLKRDFSNLCNNEQKIFPSVRLSLKELEINKKIILYVYVPSSEDAHMSNGRFYDRNEDGDYDITRSSFEKANLYNRKNKTSYENELYPDLSLEDLRLDLIDRARRMACGKNRNHPWKEMNHEEILKSAKLMVFDKESNKYCINLAGLLIFGKDEAITSNLTYYKIDALLRIKDVDRYDDRDYIKTNLIEAYDRLMAFVMKHMPDPFYLEGDKRVSVIDIIARELIVNMLIHREYFNHAAARLIIMRNKLYTENANKPKYYGELNVNDFTPVTKNPIIANFFKEIDLADELGSGFRRLVQYGKIYSNDVPKFMEGDMFKAELPLNCFNHLPQVVVHDGILMNSTPTSKYEKAILDFCVTAKTGKEIQEYIGLKDREYFRKNVLKPLIEKKVILLTIPDKPNSKNQMYITGAI